MNQTLNDFIFIPFDCNGKGGLSFGGDCVGIGLEVEEEVHDLKVSEEGRTHESGLFVALYDGVVDYFRVLFEKFPHFLGLLPLDVVVKQVLLGVKRFAVAHSNY